MIKGPKNNPFYELFKKEVENHPEKVFTKEALRKSLNCEISQSTFSRILNYNGVYPTLDVNFVSAYAKYFHVTADYLLGIRKTTVADENIAMIQKETGLSENAINVLKEETIIGHKRFAKALDLLISDLLYRAKVQRHRPFLEIFSNYLDFNDNNAMYALNNCGQIKQEIRDGYDNGRAFWGSNNLYITEKQKEELFLIEMQNILKILKEEYDNNPD